MFDDKSKKSDSRDRTRFTFVEDYEIDYLVVKSGITREQACDLFRRFGNNRETLMKHARNLV
jgi:hypothetical protein